MKKARCSRREARTPKAGREASNESNVWGTGGNGDSSKRTVDVRVEPVGASGMPPIERKEGEENSPAFWLQFANGSPERLVEKNTAIFAAKVIVDETIGRGLGNQAIVAFKSERTTVADVLAVIERLCGGPAGWQHLQRKAQLAE